MPHTDTWQCDSDRLTAAGWGHEEPEFEQTPIPDDGFGERFAAALMSLDEVIEQIAAEQCFRPWARKWKAETRFLSNVSKKVMHPAYQKIISLGDRAIPLILKDLEKNGPNDWFWALNILTEENPIPDESAGHMDAMTEAWLQWGRKAGYLKECAEKTSSASQIS